jgi:hypothetical protein
MRRRLSGYAADEVEQACRNDFGPLFSQPPEPSEIIAALRGIDAVMSAQQGLPSVQLMPPSVPVDTSEAAAAKIVPRAARDRARIYAYIVSCGDYCATEREIENALGIAGNTVRPRLWELEGNAPAGRPRPPRLIYKPGVKRGGMRGYRAV